MAIMRRATEPASASAPTAARTFARGKPVHGTQGYRVMVYGPGGIGKTTLADAAPGPVVSIDLDDSLAILNLPNTEVVAGVATWADLRAALQSPMLWDGVRTIVIDSITRAEELAVAWTLQNVPHEKGYGVKRLEDYGFGKGYQFVYETMLGLLADLDAHVRAGRNVVLIAHDCTTNVPNPRGEDWLRYEPRLQSPASGKASVRLRIIEWADHVLGLLYDVDVRDGVARGNGSRTCWTTEQPHCIAKSRTVTDPIVIGATPEARAELWKQILKGV